MAETSGDKSQEATPHRRQQAREEGQVARSQDLASAVLLIVALAALLLMGGPAVHFFIRLAEQQLGGDPWLSADADFLRQQWSAIGMGLGQVVLPIFGVMLLAAVAVNLLQVGFLFLPDKLAPDISRIDPLKGAQRLFSLSSLVRLALGVLKIVLVAGMAFWILYGRREEILSAAALDIPQIASFVVDVTLWSSLKVAGVLLLLALLDYAYQRWKHEQDLKMTSQEVREEMKNLQGDPQVIARRRQVQRQLALSRMSAAVPKADVVVTNPTELAIALQYDPQTMSAPVVVAKGSGTAAQRIRRLALQHGVPIVEKKPLAQALYKEVEINQPIPDKLYAAVAEVLAYVYQIKGKPLPIPPGG
jgi:flagellar biosynthetic protein FlhB